MKRWCIALLTSVVACAGSGDLDGEARQYVELARALDRLAPGFVDAYYGAAPAPAELTLEQIGSRARALEARLAEEPTPRGRGLLSRSRALVERVDALGGRHLSFDEESSRLLGFVPTRVAEEELDPVLEAVDDLLPGEGPLVERYVRYRSRFVVPEERVEAVLERTLEECRDRTLAHVALPPGENVRLELGSDMPWAAYHSYRGHYQSVVRINLSFPFFVDRAVEEVCHETYPGHHLQEVLAERELVEARGLLEHSMIPSRGFRAFLAEGAAGYGVSLAFPGDERLAFDRDVLFPLAGLPSEEAERYDAVRRLVRELAPAVVDGARRHLNGELDLYSAVVWLEEHALVPEPRPMLELAWRERTGILGYTVGESVARRWLESSGSPWTALVAMWTSPIFPEEP